MRSCTKIVDSGQTLNLIRVYTVSHSFSNTLDISIVSKIIIIKVIECMHAYIHAWMHAWMHGCMHTYMYIFMYGWHERTHLPTYRPTYAVRACLRVWMYASVHEFLRVMLFVLYTYMRAFSSMPRTSCAPPKSYQSPVRPSAHPNQDLYCSHKIYVSFCNLSRLT